MMKQNLLRRNVVEGRRRAVAHSTSTFNDEGGEESVPVVWQ